MIGRLPLTSEVGQVGRQSLSEEEVPQTIGQDPCGELACSFFTIGQPVRQVESGQSFFRGYFSHEGGYCGLNHWAAFI